MSRFNVRAITVIEAPPPLPPSASKSAYAAMRNGTGHVAPSAAVAPPMEEKPAKKGRPTKEEVRRHKLGMADASIQLLVEDKPTRNKIRDYMEHRILELDLEKH